MKNPLLSLTPSQFIKDGWKYAQSVPLGKKIFSRIAGQYIPYTGSIGAEILEINPGLVRVQLHDKRSVRNHLKSIHAIALVNLGEFSTGLSLISQLGKQYEVILVGINAKYLKKARGAITAECYFRLPEKIVNEQEIEIPSIIKNKSQEIVCQVAATWKVRKKG